MSRSGLFWSIVLAAFVIASITIYLVTRPDTVPEKLAAWLPGDCSRTRLSAAEASHDLGLDPSARHEVDGAERIHCDDDSLGPATTYLRFDSHRAMIRAFAAPLSNPPRKACLLEDETFGLTFLQPDQFEDSCDRLGGRIRALH